MVFPRNNVAHPVIPAPLTPAPTLQRRILLVEDNSAIRNALQRILFRAGCLVDAASTVAEGLRLIDGQDCMLLDLNLPDGLGSAIPTHVRSRAVPIHVAVMTACQDPDDLADLAHVRPDVWFTKPIVLTDLLAWLETIPHPATPPTVAQALRRPLVIPHGSG